MSENSKAILDIRARVKDWERRERFAPYPFLLADLETALAEIASLELSLESYRSLLAKILEHFGDDFRSMQDERELENKIRAALSEGEK